MLGVRRRPGPARQPLVAGELLDFGPEGLPRAAEQPPSRDGAALRSAAALGALDALTGSFEALWVELASTTTGRNTRSEAMGGGTDARSARSNDCVRLPRT